jgi:hypothetical protein
MLKSQELGDVSLVGVNQGIAVVALKDYTDAQTATAYSVAQQLVATAWGITFP